MIRLWHRVGMFRALSILVLVAGLIGGFVITDRQTQRSTANAASAAQVLDVQTTSATPTPSQDAATQDAQAKAAEAAAAAAAQAKAAEDAARASQPASRSTPRSTAPVTAYAGPIPASCEEYKKQNPNGVHKATGCAILLSMGFGIDQAPCLVKLWTKESGWNPKAENKSSHAYGIPQALPGNKMASTGSDWRLNPATQIKWGLGYIKGRYKTPCGAWGHSQAKGWY